MQHKKSKARNMRRRRRRNMQIGILLSSLLLVAIVAVGGTMAWLNTESGPITNTFKPSVVSSEVTEEFDGTTKKNVNVTNTGDTDAYIRVKLVTYRVNEEGQHIGGEAEIPSFTLGTDWVEHDGYYYYTLPVARGEKPKNDLIDSITLNGNYNDADGGKQVIEVMAEAIQSDPERAVGEAWGVSIQEGRVTAYISSEGGAGN